MWFGHGAASGPRERPSGKRDSNGMATFTYNYYYVLRGGGGVLESGFLDGTITDGEEDLVFEPGASVTSQERTGEFEGTVVVNGQTFVFVETGPVDYAYGFVPPDYVPVDEVDKSTILAEPFTVCFAAGTRILTDRGEVAVESLRAGDLVATLGQGGAPFAPVLFLGQRRIRLAGHAQAAELAPIRIRAGALAENTPHRDLLVSPDHGLFLDGALVPARLLVNGTSIVVERGLAEVTYYHIELPRHDVVLAEGAPAESWLDCGNRSWFANAPGARLSVAGTLASQATMPMPPCAPVLHSGPALAALRDRIALRARAEAMPLAA